MAAAPGFRAALWAKLAALLLLAADYFENKRQEAMPVTHSEGKDKTEAVDAIAGGRLSGAPPHWLAMVRNRAPGFLHRLETMSYQNLPVIGESSKPAQSVAAADHKPDAPKALKHSAPEPEVRFKKRPESGVTGPLKKSASIDSGRGDAKITLWIRKPETGQAGQISGKAGQTRGFDSPVQASDIGKATHRSGLTFRPERQAAVSDTFHKTAAEALPAAKTGSIPSVSKNDAAERRASSKQVPATGKSSEIGAASSEGSGPDPFPPDNDQRLVFVRPCDLGSDRVYRNDASQTTAVQDQAQMRNRQRQFRHATTGDESVSADGFWPDLTGLEKTPMNRGRWPELPEDVWNDFWPQQDTVNIALK